MSEADTDLIFLAPVVVEFEIAIEVVLEVSYLEGTEDDVS